MLSWAWRILLRFLSCQLYLCLSTEPSQLGIDRSRPREGWPRSRLPGSGNSGVAATRAQATNGKRSPEGTAASHAANGYTYTSMRGRTICAVVAAIPSDSALLPVLASSPARSLIFYFYYLAFWHTCKCQTSWTTIGSHLSSPGGRREILSKQFVHS